MLVQQAGLRLIEHLFGAAAPPDRMGYRWLARYLALAGVLALIVFARRPDSLLRPQFWAEDGSVFFSQELRLGFWSALGTLVAGFPFLLQRLIAGLAARLPTVAVPLAYNASAITITALTIATFSLPRFRHLVRSDGLRVAVCVATVCIPAGQELLATPTTLGYFLAIWLVFLSVMRTPRTRAGTAAWCVGGVVAILSTPVAPVVAPLWLLRAVRALRGHRRADLAFATTQLLALLGVIGLVVLLGGPTKFSGGRPGFEWRLGDLGSTLLVLGWTMAACVDTAILPRAVFGWLETRGVLPVVVPAAIATICVGLAFRRLASRGRVVICLALYLFASSLFLVLTSRDLVVQLIQGTVPNVSVGVLTVVVTRHRALAYVALLLVAAAIIDGVEHVRLRFAAALAACATLVFAWSPGFRVQPVPDLHWPHWAAQLDARLASGSHEPLVIPSYPPYFNIVIDASRSPTPTAQLRNDAADAGR